MVMKMKVQENSRKGIKAPVASKKRSTDAIALLKADHRTVEELFEKFEKTNSKDRKLKLVKSICEELTLHAELEENFFYPPVRETLKKDGDLLDEAQVEHNSLKWLIAQLEAEGPDSDLYDAKVTVLKEYVQHHVKEEEKQLFPKVKKIPLDLGELGSVLLDEKQKLQKKLLN
jgi:hemerythrin superfamily protein